VRRVTVSPVTKRGASLLMGMKTFAPG